jgi:amidase
MTFGRLSLAGISSVLLLTVLSTSAARAQDAMDRDLLEVTVPKLQQMYRDHKYTVTQVVQWYLARITKYNGIYRAVENVDAAGALAIAAREDAEGTTPHGALWGIPIVTKANTSIKGLITTNGWRGYTIPGHELVAPKDADIVARLRAAGAVILGQTNMPDFAASDTTRSTSYGRTGNAYDVRFSPGGSSGGTVTAVTANLAVLGNGTDTGNSIRMPSATSSVVGVFPSRGLVSIAGIAPLDWLLDNTGPIARDVTDATIALDAMAEPNPQAEPGPYAGFLKAGALKGKRFGVPAFVLQGAGVPFQGIPSSEAPGMIAADRAAAQTPLRPETRAAFMKALEGLRAAGAEVVFDDSILSDGFAETVSFVFTLPYIREGTEKFLADYGPAQYRSAEEYQKVIGSPLPPTIVDGSADLDGATTRKGKLRAHQAIFETDPQAEANYWIPRRKALEIYNETLSRLHLDGYVYPAAQMPPPDETMPQDGKISGGPHSDTSWVNMIGVPAVVLPGGFYPDGLPFGLEISARPWKDGDLLGWAYAYEQATHHRKPPVLVEKGLLPNAR